MTETRDLSDLIHSPQYRHNAVFVTACYRVLLDRDVEAEELFRWCRQLDGVYSRKALIVALSGSEKFGNRFEIKDLELYRKKAFVSRAFQYVINHMKVWTDRYDKGCFGPVKHTNIEFDFPEYEQRAYEWLDEISMLSLCQMETLRTVIKQLEVRFGPLRSVGTVSCDLVEASYDTSKTAFITSVDQIRKLIETEDPSFRRNRTIFLPIPVPTEQALAVIFDRNWSAKTNGKHPRRWLVSRRGGEILLLNNHEYPVNVKLSFTLTALINGVSVRISQGQNKTVIPLCRKAARISMKVILLPGENRIAFQYVGTAEEAEEITNIAISRLTVNGAEIVPDMDTKGLGEGYYAVVYPDSKVRNGLHRNGFSEVECVRLYHDNTVQSEATTRFLQHDSNSSGDSFYVLKEGEKQKSSSVSVRLYIAKKICEIEQSR